MHDIPEVKIGGYIDGTTGARIDEAVIIETWEATDQKWKDKLINWENAGCYTFAQKDGKHLEPKAIITFAWINSEEIAGFYRQIYSTVWRKQDSPTE